MTGRLTCREIVEFLDDSLSGGLSPASSATFNAHLAECPSCVAYAKTYLESVRLGKAALGCPGESLPESFPEDLIRAILAARGRA